MKGQIRLKRKLMLESLFVSLLSVCVVLPISQGLLSLGWLETVSLCMMAAITGYCLYENIELKAQRKRGWDYWELEMAQEDEHWRQLRLIQKESHQKIQTYLDSLQLDRCESILNELELLTDREPRPQQQPEANAPDSVEINHKPIV